MSFGSFVSNLTHTAAHGIGSAYDYLTPGLGSSRLTDWGTPAAPTQPKPNYGTGSYGTPGPSSINIPSYLPGANTTTPVPRLPTFDISTAYNKALQAATKAQNPVYAAQLTNFVNQQQQALAEQQQGATASKSALDVALGRLQQDNATNKQRTSADTATGIADINAGQDYTTRQEGTNFDTTNRATNEALGASGLAGSGLGQQQVEQNQRQFRDMSNEEIRQTNNKVAAANTLMNRTFQDLDTQEKRTTEDTGTKKTQIDVDVQNFIKDQQLGLESEKGQLEASKQAAIVQSTGAVQHQLVQQWLQSLRGAGYTPQEIALASSVYGG
jgi:hypothetical protein